MNTRQYPRRLLSRAFREVYGRVWPRGLASYLYKKKFGRSINWTHPRDLNEKINWLSFYSDTTEWTRLADKYRVRDYVTERGLADILVPLYGHWDRARDIDWGSLPTQFVMKVNNGCGDVLICDDKSKLDIASQTKTFRALLHKRFGLLSAEPHYLKIKPCIVAEALLDVTTQVGGSMVDYKIWCFDGKAEFILVCSERSRERVALSVFDKDWNAHPEYQVYTAHYVKPTHEIVRPASFDRMFSAAEQLAAGFPEVRVDFYDVAGQLYFGEMTFTSCQGRMQYFSQDFLNILGDMVALPTR